MLAGASRVSGSSEGLGLARKMEARIKATKLEANNTAQALLTPNHPARAVAAATTAILPISPNAAKFPMAVPRFFDEECFATRELPIGSNSPDAMPPKTYARYRKPV